MNEKSKKIKSQLTTIVAVFSQQLPKAVICEIHELIDANEYGVAYELLADMLYEFDIKVSNNQLASLLEMADIVFIDRVKVNFLNELVSV